MNKYFRKTNKVNANQNEAMEANTISKNGMRPKGLINRGKFLRKARIAFLVASIVLCECVSGQVAVSGNVMHTGGPGVYVAVSEENAQEVYVAKLWKNGVVQNLTDGTRNAGAGSVFVSGNDVYVAGGVNERAVLWKNGVAQYLSNEDEEEVGVSSVYVSGNDVYVAGVVDATAVLWKNGVAQYLGDEDDGTSSASSVYVSGRDVYVAGTLGYGEAGGARLWKNGVKQYLEDGDNYFMSAHSVFVSGSDVYVAGEDDEKGKAVLWKNGVKQKLTKNGIQAFSVFVSGSDVYVAGNIGKYAVLWKNGMAQNLTDGTRDAFARFVFVVKREGMGKLITPDNIIH